MVSEVKQGGGKLLSFGSCPTGLLEQLAEFGQPLASLILMQPPQYWLVFWEPSEVPQECQRGHCTGRKRNNRASGTVVGYEIVRFYYGARPPLVGVRLATTLRPEATSH